MSHTQKLTRDEKTQYQAFRLSMRDCVSWTPLMYYCIMLGKTTESQEFQHFVDGSY